MGIRLGSGYIGSSNLQTSVANEEIIPSPPQGQYRYNCYTFSFMNDQACSVVINNSSSIYLRANQGFNMDENDAPIISFKIVENGITFNWIAAI